MPTQRQINAVKELAEDGRNKGKALLRAGYSIKTVDRPKKVTESKGFKEAAKDFVNELKKERNRIIKAMSERNLKKVDYDKLSAAMDRIVKNEQLLSGGATERVDAQITGMRIIEDKL